MKQGFAKGMVLSAIILTDLLVGMEFDLFVPAFLSCKVKEYLKC